MRFMLWVWLLPMTLVAQIPAGVLTEFSTSRGGGVHRLRVFGDYLYAAEGSSLMVYDTHSATYSLAFEKRFSGPITDMVLHKGALYITANHDGLTKWDIAIPIRPVMVGEYRPDDFQTSFHALQWSADTLYVSANSGVWLFTEQAGFGPMFEKRRVIVEQMEDHGRVIDSEILGGNCIAAVVGKEKGIGQGVHAFRISPEARLNFHHYADGEIVGLQRLGNSQRVLAFGGTSTTGESQLMAIDFSNAASPQMYWSDTVYGNHATVGAGIVKGDTLFVPIVGHLHRGCADSVGAIAFYDVHDPTQIRYLGQLALPAVPQHVAVQGSTLFVALGDKGIVSYDLRQWKAGGCCRVVSPRDAILGTGGYCQGADAFGDKLLDGQWRSRCFAATDSNAQDDCHQNLCPIGRGQSGAGCSEMGPMPPVGLQTAWRIVW
jgi:hypothetical protein